MILTKKAVAGEKNINIKIYLRDKLNLYPFSTKSKNNNENDKLIDSINRNNAGLFPNDNPLKIPLNSSIISSNGAPLRK